MAPLGIRNIGLISYVMTGHDIDGGDINDDAVILQKNHWNCGYP